MGSRQLTNFQSAFCDGLRWVAALAVALHHCLDNIDYAPYEQAGRTYYLNMGSLGIALFFLLSGFLIAYTVGKKSEKSPYTFPRYFIERSVRIYLVYLPAIVLAVIVVALLRDNIFASPDATLQKLITNIFMLQGVEPISQHNGHSFALLGPSWTLAYEYWLYLLFGLAVLPMGKRRAWNVLSGLAVLGVLFVLAGLHNVRDYAAIWFAGAAIAWLYQNWRMPGLVSAALVALGVGVIVATISTIERGYGMWGVYAGMAAIFAGIISLDFKAVPSVSRGVAHHLASYSYSLYLTHIIWLFVIEKTAREQTQAVVGEWGKLGAAFVLLAVVNLCAYAFSWITEQHNESVRRWFLSRGKAGLAAQAAAPAPGPT